MIHVIAAIRVAPGKRDELIAAFQTLTPTVRAEEGCHEYETTVDVATPIDAQESVRDDTVVVVEKWESVDALQAHLAAPHMEAFRSAMAGVITGVSLQVLEPA